MSNIENFYDILNNNNFEYGFISKFTNAKITIQSCEVNNESFWKTAMREYFLQTPSQILNSKVGVCWDYAELERYIFTEKLHIPHNIFAIIQKNNKSSMHTFLLYKLNNNSDKIFWFEFSWKDYAGTYFDNHYRNHEEAIIDIHDKMKQDNDDNGFTCYNLRKLPQFGIGLMEYMDWVSKQEVVMSI